MVFNEKEAGVLSELENQVILALREAHFGDRVDDSGKSLIEKSIAFVLSEKYVDAAKKSGRI